MILTHTEIEGAIWQSLKASAIARKLSGKVYRARTRPRNSKVEDAVVTFVSGRADQNAPQTGIITVNIFVPDIVLTDGTTCYDGTRCPMFETLLQAWYEGLNSEFSNWSFEQQAPAHLVPESNTNQTIVAMTIKYRIY